MITRSAFAEWLAAYERLWRTAGTDSLSDIFRGDATYSMGPYEPVARGVEAIADLWDGERPDGEQFTMAAHIVAVDGDVGVASVEVHYSAPLEREYRDLWIVRFGTDGRAISFAEWAYWPPGQNED